MVGWLIDWLIAWLIQVHCTSKTSALRDVEDAFRQAKDDHYDREAEKKETGTHT